MLISMSDTGKINEYFNYYLNDEGDVLLLRD